MGRWIMSKSKCFEKFLNKITEVSNQSAKFKNQTEEMISYINEELTEKDIKELVKDIGSIPECIKASSSEEKLFSKCSDILLARCFKFLGLKSSAIDERSDNADIIAESRYHKYSLVADAKCFRMSRTAKNQKDFKISALSRWRGKEHEYAVLVAPYFLYPKEKSQIYKAALDENVCLLSWEHISIMIENKVSEDENTSLESIWNSSRMLSRDGSLAYKNAEHCFLPNVNDVVSKKIGKKNFDFLQEMDKYKKIIKERGKTEISYCKSKLDEIRNYDKEKAISELIKETKLEERIATISSYIKSLEGD